MENFAIRKKLAAYSAVSIAFVALNHERSNAQIIYHDVNPDIDITKGHPAFLDLNNDGKNDFKFFYTETGMSRYSSTTNYASSYWVKSLGKNQVLAKINGANREPAGLVAGAKIDSNELWGSASGEPMYYRRGSFTSHQSRAWQGGEWDVPGDRYLGIRLKMNDGYHYGWIRLTTGETIRDYAYQNSPNVSILAGDSLQIVSGIDATNPLQVIVFADDRSIHVNLPKELFGSEVLLFDEMGILRETVLQSNSENIFESSNLSRGIYFVRIRQGGHIWTRKIVIE